MLNQQQNGHSAKEPLEETFKTVKMRKMCMSYLSKPSVSKFNTRDWIWTILKCKKKQKHTCAWTNSNFQPLNLPPASHASLGNWRLKSNTWINKKVGRVCIYLDIRCYGGKAVTLYMSRFYIEMNLHCTKISEKSTETIKGIYKTYLILPAVTISCWGGEKLSTALCLLKIVWYICDYFMSLSVIIIA